MKKSFGQYRRLARGLLGMSSVWMGEDQIVYVKGSGFLLPFSEQYRRFRYQDIQYLAVTKTSRLWSTLLYTLGFLLFGGIIAAISMISLNNNVGQAIGIFTLVTLGIMAAFALGFLLLLGRHRFLGPTCVCDLRTSQHRERLRPLSRLHLANQAMELLEEAILEKQKHLVEVGIEPTEFSAADLRRRAEERLSIGRTVLPAFIDYTIFGVVALGALHFESVILCMVALALAVLGNLLVTSSIVRSFRQASPESIRKLLFGLFSAVMVFGAIGIVYFVHMASSNPEFTVGVLGPFEAFAGIPTLGGMAYYFLFLGSTLSILALALTGIWQTLNWNKKMQSPEGGEDEVEP